MRMAGGILLACIGVHRVCPYIAAKDLTLEYQPHFTPFQRTPQEHVAVRTRINRLSSIS